MKIMIAGDVCPKDERVNELFKKGDIKTLFGDAVELFKGNDLNFVNLECALTESTNAIEKFGPNLKACAGTADVLKKVGVTLCGLSNNHIFDFGSEGYLDTVRELDRVGIDYTGFGENYEDSRKNYIFEKDGEKLCIVNVCEHEYSYALENRRGSRPYDAYDTIADVRRAKEECDRVIVIYHGGKEHSSYPSPRMVKLAHALIDNGADLFAAQHSHCICPYEEYNGGHIIYGQGNFHFVWNSTNVGWPKAVEIKYDTKTHKIEFIPTVMRELGIELAKGEEGRAILDHLSELSQSMKDGSYKEKWHEFCLGVAKFYNDDMIGRAYAPDCDEIERKRLGHLLDCEAHTDVLRELNKTANETNI